MRTKFGLALVASLLFVGAGCAAGVQQDASIDADGTTEKGETIRGAVDIDTEVETMLKNSDDETSEARESESDASEVGADDKDIDAMIKADYDIK